MQAGVFVRSQNKNENVTYAELQGWLLKGPYGGLPPTTKSHKQSHEATKNKRKHGGGETFTRDLRALAGIRFLRGAAEDKRETSVLRKRDRYFYIRLRPCILVKPFGFLLRKKDVYGAKVWYTQTERDTPQRSCVLLLICVSFSCAVLFFDSEHHELVKASFFFYVDFFFREKVAKT